jgi:hypothetical protein
MVTMNKSIIILILSVVSLVSIYLGIKGCNRPVPQPGINNPIISVTPIIDRSSIDKLNIPELPNNEKPTSVIPVPTQVPQPGKIIIPHVVISDKGNTFIAYSEKIELRFKMDPKVSFGVSDKFLLGADLTFFSWYRVNADALAYLSIEDNFDISDTRVGLGVSYQLTNNTSTGIGYLSNFKSDKSVVGFVSFKF